MNTPQAGTNLTGLRDHNTALVLGLLRAARQGSSRVELAAGTGLTPQAISKIVARLLATTLIEEDGRGASTGGKPRTLLRLRPDAGFAVGVELDRHATTVLLVDLSGETRCRTTVPAGLADAPPQDTVELIAATVREVAAAAPPGANVLGVGVGCRGPLDQATGVLHRPAGLSAWDRFPLRDALAARLDPWPVRLDKDANTAALACAAPGHTAYLHFSDGLGAGLLLDGAVYRGARTNAGEFGHQVIQLDGPACGCGARGCLEALCLAALATGDHRAAARLLAVGVANLVQLLDVDRVVLGGQVVFAAPELYLAELAGQLAARLPDREWQRVPVSLTPAGPAAVAIGAAELVLGPLFGRRT
ncbi:ROK family protein [Kitasatospora kifunensis]|uniref:Putative NBD/HSP70 family sugar kinase n=1 Tax=Kitasatospora kifunensis TaxID=58351 RepID=A0A7W7VSH8_KITKI|nr:ROK family protein [Kitasatospora kifunensis]MBB4921162.1 putative NBD/HSP70 family sugar kinase [Kitasatospora kifunensis]